jgi:hypothetical protein
MKTFLLMPKQLSILLLVTFLFISCKKDYIKDEAFLNKDQNAINNISGTASKIATQTISNNGTTITEIPFTATAAIAYCYGENIVVTGIIENKVNSTVDGNGVIHYTRHWTVKGLIGRGTLTGTVFDVVGGAEMFSVKDAVLNPNGTLNISGSLAQSDVFIHQGTIVLVSRTDGSRIVARHIIRKVPGRDTIVNHWVCGGN